VYQSDYPDALPSSIGLPWYKIWWKALVPEGEAYEIIAADPRASVGRACLWVFATNLVCSGIMMLLFGAIVGLAVLSTADASGEEALAGLGITAVVLVCLAPVIYGIMGVVGLLMMSGLSHTIASALGGTGTFTKLTYAFGAYLAPLMIVSMVISFIPIVNYLGFVVGIYGLVLNIMAVKAVHRLDWGRSIASSAIIWVGLLCCVAFVVIMILTLMGPSIGNVFSSILEDLATPMP
jgi:hypothetical protein